jgi:hypothetical protein
MAPLDSGLRSALERAIVAAREASERAARAALETLAVERAEPFATLGPDQRQHRVALRARARQLGGGNQGAGMPLLVEEVAYEQWHRMLFARFLAENDLLMHPSGVAVTLEECADLAPEEGEPDAWQLAARYAAAMLPGIFRADDPSAQVRFAPEGRATLETILSGLPSAIFTSDDGLGWVYQFWQSKQKDEVNATGLKIGDANLAPVTQLFTENYMVRFLLENSLGAWWAARHPDSPLVKAFSYLRIRDDGRPAAGTFPDWPTRAADLTVMDPCCGSGHFLSVAFDMLRRMRMEEEALSEADAAEAVLCDNLHGIELDPRCVQIAVFSLALAAWRAGGYRQLPVPKLACSGIPVTGQLEEWTRLVGNDPDLRNSLERLYQLFRRAPTLGSLIDPANVPLRDRMFAPDFSMVVPILDQVLSQERITNDPVARVFGGAARGVAHAAALLAGQYTLLATNVPYLLRRKQTEALQEFADMQFPLGRANLATMFIERCRAMTQPGGTYALVTPQSWLSLGSYGRLRQELLTTQSWLVLTALGPGAFETISGEVVNVILVIINNSEPLENQMIASLETSDKTWAVEKASQLRTQELQWSRQRQQLRHPDARIIIGEQSSARLLASYAKSSKGCGTGDDARYRRFFWEMGKIPNGWRLLQSSVKQTSDYGGCESVFWYDEMLKKTPETVFIRGQDTWGKRGVIVTQMNKLPCSLSLGEAFDQNAAVILPRDPADLPAIWAFCKSSQYANEVRRIDPGLKVTNATLVKIPFDIDYWRKFADESAPLPEPYSSDPTQWLFNGDPIGSSAPLQVGVARLLGYRWPQQEPDHLAHLADEDGIAPLVPAAGEEPATERLRALLAAAYGAAWSADLQERLLQEVGFGGKGLEGWLRDGLFDQHCKLFQQRPFIWHIWDGRRTDGFSALVNYHKLDAARLDKLIYTYLGGWIRAQRDARDAGVAGAEARLVAALELQKKLEAIRDGEPPYDIYVRWKPLHEQPIGWTPDLNDGVRLNIRPFVEAGILRSRVNIKWGIDRGRNPDGSVRDNDVHLTTAEKRAARERASRADASEARPG